LNQNAQELAQEKERYISRAVLLDSHYFYDSIFCADPVMDGVSDLYIRQAPLRQCAQAQREQLGVALPDI